MRLAVKTNLEEVFAEMDQFVQQIETVAMSRALNRLREQAQVAGLRRIAEIYKLGPRTTEKYVTYKLATTTNLEASIAAKGQGFPLALFQPRKTPAGISVSIKGRRVIIPHSFMATMRSGRIGVFARGAYGGKGLAGARPTGASFGRFQYARGRSRKGMGRGAHALPINEFYTFGPAETLGNPEVTEAMEQRIEEQASKVIASEIRFATR